MCQVSLFHSLSWRLPPGRCGLLWRLCLCHGNVFLVFPSESETVFPGWDQSQCDKAGGFAEESCILSLLLVLGGHKKSRPELRVC